LLIIGINQDKELLTQTRIAEKINKPVTSVNYWITKFYGEGLIQSKNPLKLSDKGLKEFKFYWYNLENSKILRAHNIQVICDIVCNKDCLRRIGEIAEPFTNKRYRGLKFDINGCKVFLYSKSKLIVHLSQISANNDEEIAGRIIEEIPQLLDLLKQEYRIKIKSYKLANYQSMHCAILNSSISEHFITKKGRIYNSEGIDIDKSHGKYEIETKGIKALQNIEGLMVCEAIFKEMLVENKRLKEELRKKEKGDEILADRQI
jgi:hypothetical protein